MSKRFSFLMVGLLLVVFALAACSGGADSGEARTESGTETAAAGSVVTSEASTETETGIAPATETAEVETEEVETEEATETSAAAGNSGRTVSFSNDVWPIFQANCSGCHGASGGLNLASYDTLMAGGRRGAVIVPGDAESSRLVQYVESGRMPPSGNRLSNEEIQTIKDWVNAGAPNN